MSTNETQANGWTAVPVSGKKIIEARGEIPAPAPTKVEEVFFPSDNKLVKDAHFFAKQRLSPEAFNHSMRVFYWGTPTGHSPSGSGDCTYANIS